MNTLILRLLVATLVTSLWFSASAVQVSATATPPVEVICGVANVDGNIGEWTEVDFVANMTRAGKPQDSNHPVESKLYLRYDANTGTLYAMVKTVGDAIVIEDEDEAFIKVNDVKKVDGNSGDNGVPPDFRWTGNGFEASLTLAQGTWTLDVHLQVLDDGESQTSALLNRALSIKIECEEDPPSTVKIVKTVVGGTAQASDFDFTIGGIPAKHNEVVQVTPGTIQVYEDPEPGYIAGQWGGDCTADGQVTVAKGENKVCTITNTAEATTETATVCKFEDKNGDGIKDDDEPGIEGWPIRFPNDPDNPDDDVVKYTGPNGCVTVELPFGDHRVCEDQKDGWVITTGPLCRLLEITPKPPETIWFGNRYTRGTIIGIKFHDANEDGQKGSGEALLADVVINLYKKGETTVLQSAETDNNGKVTFSDIPEGDYTMCEEVPAGWEATTPTCVDFKLMGGEVVTKYFGNSKPPTALPEQPQPPFGFQMYVPSISN